jgi:hypothetical protein
VTTLGVDTAVVLVGLAALVAVIALGLLVVAPWKSVREEPPLDDEVETRLLLGEDPETIAADVDRAEGMRAPVHDLDPELTETPELADLADLADDDATTT